MNSTNKIFVSFWFINLNFPESSDPDMAYILILIPDSFKIQSRYDPDSDVILSLIQNTVQIRSRFGCHSVTCPDSNYSTDTLQTQKSFCYSYRSQLQLRYRYTPDTTFVLIFRSQLQFRYTPDTVVILLLYRSQLRI